MNALDALTITNILVNAINFANVALVFMSIFLKISDEKHFLKQR